MLPFLLACEPAPPPADSVPTGTGLFEAGCPVPGESRARVLTEPSETPWGEEALAAPGDILLYNEVAAFVIQGPDVPRTYYHYGGAPIDAVAVEGCEQAGPERFEEMGFIVGQLDLVDFNASTLHQVRATAAEIVGDGVVEISATDDRFWLVEETLVRATYEDGGRKELGALYGLDITIRYTLEPGSDALLAEVLLDGSDAYMVGAIVFPSDLTTVTAQSGGELSVGGFHLDLDVPWLAMSSPEASFAVAMPDAAMGYTSISGVRALLDVNHASSPVTLEPTPFVLATAAGTNASAGLEAWIRGEWADVAGTVSDDRGPVAGATVDLGSDLLYTDADGRYAGRATTAPISVSAAGRDADGLSLGPEGALLNAAVDGEGAPIPVRIEAEREDGTVVVHYALPGESLPLPPGDWTLYVSRGYEYAPATIDVTVPEHGSATLDVTLEHVVDTTGWASVDTHVHAEASADSSTLAVDRMVTAVASGLDVVVSTDHEAIIDLSAASAGFEDWLAYGLGSEITATIPEHVNAWPFPVSDDPRGEPVRWYELGFPGIYAAARDRGARVVQLNHSRVNGECGILCLLDWDRVSESVVAPDPQALALPAGTEIWSWDFDSFEVINGLRSPLLDPADPRHTGALVDWLAFHNLGHRVTGVAVTDVHGKQIPGEPRTYVRVADDTPGVVTADDVADGQLEGAAVMSAGAFAEVTVGEAGPGELGTGELRIEVRGLPEIDVTRVVVLVNCDEFATLAAAPDALVKLDTTVALDLTTDAHVVVMGFGERSMPRGLDDYDAATVPRFLTNPIFVDGDGDGEWTAPGAKACTGGEL